MFYGTICYSSLWKNNETWFKKKLHRRWWINVGGFNPSTPIYITYKVGPQWCLLVSKAQVASTKAEDVFTVQCHHECRQQSSQQTWCIVEFLGWNKKQQNHGDYRISNGFGFFVFFVLLCLFFVFFWCSPRGPPQRVSKDFLVGSMIFVNSLPGILPKEYQNIVVFLFVWRCTYEYVQIAAKCEHKKWACYIVNHSTNSMSEGRGGDIYIYICTYMYIYIHSIIVLRFPLPS